MALYDHIDRARKFSGPRQPINETATPARVNPQVTIGMTMGKRLHEAKKAEQEAADAPKPIGYHPIPS